MKTYFRCLASGLILLALFPMVVVFAQLFFYEKFSVGQTALQVGLQFVLFNLAYLGLALLKRIWKHA